MFIMNYLRDFDDVFLLFSFYFLNYFTLTKIYCNGIMEIINGEILNNSYF